MSRNIQEIDREIQNLKEELNRTEGTTTEVYSRIVGYYRSVKNWNLGKKEEYKQRREFTDFLGRTPRLQEISPVTGKAVGSPDDISGFSFFYRSSCPNCPAMKEVLDNLDLEGDYLNVDMERGLDAASEYNVFSAPTVIFHSESGEEVFRTGNPSDVKVLFDVDSETA